MAGKGRIPLLAALLLFSLFFANVAAGAAGVTTPLTDITEMLTLLASAILFVVGVLIREAAARANNKSN